MGVLNAICNSCWAITPEALETILEVVQSHSALSREQWESRLQAIQDQRGGRLEYSRNATPRGSVGVLPVAGPIVRRADFFSRVSGMSDASTLATDLKGLADDPSINSILLEIDSPGGEVAGIEELAAQIRQADARKPVVAYVDGVAASAAYWLASAAREVVGGPTSMVGSIGVVSVHRDTRKAQERMGVSTHEIVSSQSPNKRPDVTTDRGRQQVQAMVDSLASEFIAAVARYRGVSAEAVRSDFGRGGMLMARDAKRAGMIDRIEHQEPLIARLNRGKYPEPRGAERPPQNGPSPAGGRTNASWVSALVGG